MPVEMSPRLLTEFSAPRQPLTHLLVRTRLIRRAVRLVERKLLAPPRVSCQHAAVATDQLEQGAAAFGERGWGFVDPFFEADFFGDLRAGWPQRQFFSPMHNPLKSYDFGFRWHRDRASPIKHLDRFPALAAAYAMLRSSEFSQRATSFCADGIERTCFSLTSTWATSRSALIPHRDTVALDRSGGSFINFVIFIDANGSAPYAGGTCIIADNEYRNLLFEPTHLTNTALVYRSNAEFFHGFKPMAPDAFRWTLNAQYCDVAWKNTRGVDD